MHCIIAATDGSESADRAVDFAADLAAKFDARLILMHVVAGTTLIAKPNSFAHPQVELRARARLETTSIAEVVTEAAENLLDRVRYRAAVRGARHIESEVRAGAAAEAIIAVAEERQADGIVLGRRGHGRLARLLLGSVSEKVAAHASCPLILVP